MATPRIAHPRSIQLKRLRRRGDSIALVSDAGMPLVSDPGYAIVQGCVAAGLAVEVLPGPSSAITALVAETASLEELFLGLTGGESGDKSAPRAEVA